MFTVVTILFMNPLEYAVYCVKLIFFKDKYSFPLGEYIIEWRPIDISKLCMRGSYNTVLEKI